MSASAGLNAARPFSLDEKESGFENSVKKLHWDKVFKMCNHRAKKAACYVSFSFNGHS